VVVRLRRAREQLRKRLQQRGYLLSSGLAATLGISSSSAQLGILALPLSQTALHISSYGLTTGLLSPAVACLLKGALLTMWLKPIQLTTLAVLSLGLVTLPLWNDGTSLQAQPPEHAKVAQQYFIGGMAGHTYQTPPATKDATYPHDVNLPEEARKWIDEQKMQEEVIRQESEQRMRGKRMILHGKLKQLQETYTKAGDLDRALPLREQVRRLELAIANAVVYHDYPNQIGQLRGQNGKTIMYSVRARTGAAFGAMASTAMILTWPPSPSTQACCNRGNQDWSKSPSCPVGTATLPAPATA